MTILKPQIVLEMWIPQKDICAEGEVLSEESSKECRLPQKGHYADGDDEKACTDISNKGDWVRHS